MNILAIETSCDETAISIMEAEGDMNHTSFRVDANVVLSQIEEHREYGGVFPTVAKREHSRNLVSVLNEALEQAGISKTADKARPSEALSTTLKREPELLEQFTKGVPKENPDIDAIAVTHGPGLEPALWVGVNFAKALAAMWDVPLVPVNHMEGHIFSALMRAEKNSTFEILNSKFPKLALLVSGGHTELVLVKDWLHYEKIGQTRDDAAGEAFDKVARILELPYPGGPEISKLAESIEKGRSGTYQLPRPMLDSGDYDFSFSGLKTAVLYMVKDIPEMTDEIRAKIAYEFQEAAVEVLVKKTLGAAREYDTQTILLGGGVAANARLREELGARVREEMPDTTLLLPDRSATTDNAAMIAVAGYFRYLNSQHTPADKIKADGNLSL